MKNMTLVHIAKACEGEYHGRIEEKLIEVKGVVLDSRKVEKDFLFIATRGERVDGHSFIAQVFERGAACVVCEEAPEVEDKPYILVKDSFSALQKIAAFYREQLSVKVVGITGSVGKTTTKEFIASVLEQKYSVLKTQGNFNNEVGLPLTVLQIRDEHEVAVLEMGINHFGEMDRLGTIAKPDICVMTNIGQCHLEFLGSREGILKAKSEMLAHLQPNGIACVNGDDDMLATIDKVQGREPVTFGISETNTIYATDMESKGLRGTVCRIHTKEGTLEANIPLPGRHMVYNALAATAVGFALELSKEEIQKGIQAVSSVGGRSHIISGGERVIIDDCYNANPVSMEAAIDLLTLAEDRKVAILGDMGELGDEEVRMHEAIGVYAVEKKIDVLICIGKLSRFMAEAAKKENGKQETMIYWFETKEEAQEELANLIKEKDTILVKASHFMGFEDIVKALQ